MSGGKWSCCMRLRWLGAISVAAVLSLLAQVAFQYVKTNPVRTETNWIDPVTGSRRSQVRWFGSVRLPMRYEASALERWIVREEGSYLPAWQIDISVTSNAFNLPFQWACGKGAPINQFELPLMERWVNESSPEEIARVVQIMREGSREEQRKAIAAACDQVRRPDEKPNYLRLIETWMHEGSTGRE
jgi:hypothetical protein